MEHLNDNDFKVLVRIERNLLSKGARMVPEFPGIKGEKLKQSVEKLKYMGYVVLNESNKWTVTYEGEQLLQKQGTALERFFDEYNARRLEGKI